MDRLTVDIKPSVTFCLLCTAVHVAALAALWIAEVPVPLAAALAVALVASLAFYLCRFGLLTDGACVRRIDWQTSGWWLGLADGRSVPVTMKDRFVVTRYLVVMHFEGQGGANYPVALTVDSTTAVAFRRLKVLLRVLPAEVSRR